MRLLEYLHQFDEYVTFDKNTIVRHTTSEKMANIIKSQGFKTGHELNVAEKRKAIYFSDPHVNTDVYARNNEGDTYENQKAGYVDINIKGLKLLNLTYEENGKFPFHKLYSTYVVRGELNKIPLDIDGVISFLEDGSIYEVCLSKETANKCLIKFRPVV